MSERIDETGFADYKLIQDTDGFCYGVDAVLLAHFSACKNTDEVLELGSGNGAVSFIINAKYSPERIVGVEKQKKAFDLSIRSVALNGLEDKISFICADVLDIGKCCEESSFDVVVCNPPYFEKGASVPCDTDEKHIARHESTAGIGDFIAAAAYALKKNGKMYLIHRPSRIADIICEARNNNMEPKLMQFIVPHPGQSPNLVLIQLVKNAGRELRVLPEISVRDSDGNWSEEIDVIYGRAAQKRSGQ